MAKCTEKEMSYRDAVTALADAREQLAAANAEIERLRAELEAATRRAKLPHPELAYKAIMARSEQLKEDHPHA